MMNAAKRFHAEPIVQAAELLLQERMPRDVAVARPAPEQVTIATHVESIAPKRSAVTTQPIRACRVRLMANGVTP